MAVCASFCSLCRPACPGHHPHAKCCPGTFASMSCLALPCRALPCLACPSGPCLTPACPVCHCVPCWLGRLVLVCCCRRACVACSRLNPPPCTPWSRSPAGLLLALALGYVGGAPPTPGLPVVLTSLREQPCGVAGNGETDLVSPLSAKTAPVTSTHSEHDYTGGEGPVLPFTMSCTSLLFHPSTLAPSTRLVVPTLALATPHYCICTVTFRPLC